MKTQHVRQWLMKREQFEKYGHHSHRELSGKEKRVRQEENVVLCCHKGLIRLNLSFRFDMCTLILSFD